jgi:hypothetical protein
MSSAKRDQVPTTSLDRLGRAGKRKALCLLAGFVIVVSIATAGWMYIVASLVSSLATWIFG